jgi:hypothetical protein
VLKEAFMVFDDVVHETRQILEANRDVVSEWAAKRRRFEPWLQLEVFTALKAKRTDFKREEPYAGRKGWCDFRALEHDGSESWVELKLIATNYSHCFTEPVASRPITNQIAAVVADVEKLRRLEREVHRGVLLLVYPMPSNYDSHAAWSAHLARIGCSGVTVTECFRIPLERNGKSANLVAYKLVLGTSCEMAA